jgi:hypothetical protein
VPTDDTRDVALEARASASSAHKRLDTINGQIARGAQATEDLRKDMSAGFAKISEDLADGMIALVQAQATQAVKLEGIGTTVKNALRVVTVIVTLAMSIIGGVSIYKLTQHAAPPPPPSQATTQYPK